MFLTSEAPCYSGYYNRHGEQTASGRFLILASDDANNLYGCVRFVRMRQCGHFMMGSAQIADKRVILSGSYGNDGLPLDWNRDLTDKARAKFVRLTESEAQAYWHPEHAGWNSTGSEAPDMAIIGAEILAGTR